MEVFFSLYVHWGDGEVMEVASRVVSKWVVLEAIHESVDLFDLMNCISFKLTLNSQLLHFPPI